MGEVDGEKEKFCWKGPADVMMGSLSMLNVSSGNGTPGWLFCCAIAAGLEESRE
jgi:hypothetical protein